MPTMCNTTNENFEIAKRLPEIRTDEKYAPKNSTYNISCKGL